MKVKHILLNILPLPLWIGYYLITLSKNKELFMISFDEVVCLIIILAFTIYNLFSHRVIEFVVRNLISVASFTIGCLISGQIYLKLCYHMSDEYYAVKSIPFDLAIGALVITIFACVVSYFITRKKSK